MNPGTEPAVGVNVFEGCRRIALALKVAWLIVVALVVAILPGPRIDNTTVWGYAILAAAAGWFALSDAEAHRLGCPRLRRHPARARSQDVVNGATNFTDGRTGHGD